MTRRKSGEESIRCLRKISGGASYGITIPLDFVRRLNWKARQKLEVKIYKDRIIIRDWKQ